MEWEQVGRFLFPSSVIHHPHTPPFSPTPPPSPPKFCFNSSSTAIHANASVKDAALTGEEDTSSRASEYDSGGKNGFVGGLGGGSSWRARSRGREQHADADADADADANADAAAAVRLLDATEET